MDFNGTPLGFAVREEYKASLRAQVAAGDAGLLVVPYHLLGAFILPALYLTIPHTRRPWLYQSRWIVAIASVGFNINLMRTTSSTNMAFGYATGLLGYWGLLLNMAWLVWTKPQFEMERIMKRRKRTAAQGEEEKRKDNSSGQGNGAAKHSNGGAPRGMNGSAKGSANGSAKEAELLAIPAVETTGVEVRNGMPLETKRRGAATEHAPETSSCPDDEFEYYWQAFPEDAPFLTRLDWVLDLIMNFRGSGWNWAISAIPHAPPPSKPLSGSLADVSAIPASTIYGFTRPLSNQEFLFTRLRGAILSYLALDFLSVCMMKDPFFILGPNRLPLPPYLQALHPLLLYLYRAAFTLAGVIAALQAIFSHNDLAQYLYLARVLPGGRAELWHQASTFGGFDNVLDRGLAGFWGGWWHQTFRWGFTAPVEWAVRQGYLTRGAEGTKLLAMVAAFANSGMLHLCGSWTSVPKTQLWRAPTFFALQCLGVLLQRGWSRAMAQQIERLPKGVRRTGNVVFVLAWLAVTAKPLVDDFANSGLWLYEPVPVSLLRWWGFGHPGDSWWRWDRDHWPFFHVGKNWWQTGMGL